MPEKEGLGRQMTADKTTLVDIILEVLGELGASETRPQHRSRFNPIIEARWKTLGHHVAPDSDFGQQISAELHRYSSDSAKWKDNAKRGQRYPDLFKMHRQGYWSIRDTVVPQVPTAHDL